MTRHQAISNHRNITSHRTPISHKALYRRWLDELWGGYRIAEELVSPDFVGHWPTRDVHGPTELQKVVDNTRGALRELRFVVEVGPFVDGDMVAARWIATGAGATGPTRLTGNDILRVANGTVVEYWSGISPG
ncbi:Uncharacterised protein [Mycolicibacterium vanbaalenii]|uniref:SnoaL-like domain-containing protein n=2 Tax=Mycolicibacterium vanbaalenii TaxID=110539 RepID=A0A5S9PYK2_MYCVN|nr:Uncharacterised protein [Mycolicibacterium vanbaalenii]